MRLIITEKIFKIISKKQVIEEQDPDYTIISDNLKAIPDERLNDFYIFLVSKDTYFNSAGFMMPYKFIEAIDAYKRTMLEELWVEHNVYEKAMTLMKKIQSIKRMLKNTTAQKAYDYCASVQADKIMTKDNKQLFTKEEIAILANKGIKYYIEGHGEKFQFENELLELLERECKHYIEKQYAYTKNSSETIVKISLLGENNE